MYGIKYIKSEPTNYILHYKGEKLIKEGRGLSFFYFAPTSTIILVPIGSADIPFIIQEQSSDFQEITIQGNFTYQITNPKATSELLDFSIETTNNGFTYKSEDPEKLSAKITNIVRVLIKSEIQKLNLKSLLKESDKIVKSVKELLKDSESLRSSGVSILDFSILAIKSNPETAKALEAEVREEILRSADEAIYIRRNSAVEQERKIKENELKTELSVDQKRREINEKKMEASISVEEKRQKLVDVKTINMKKEADAQEYATTAAIKPLMKLDPKALQVLASSNMNPQQVISSAFKEIAENASNIGTLNITPDLLNNLMNQQKK
jgi:prophage antirepressor-like protein